jgi:signal transduction histidine kinase
MRPFDIPPVLFVSPNAFGDTLSVVPRCPTVMPDSPPTPPPPLSSVLRTEQLSHRPSGPPDYQTENRALTALATALAHSPRTILQALTDTILDVLRCGSAGISMLSDDGARFEWPALAGAWAPYLGGGTPRDFGPCGDVLDCDCPLLFARPERRYAYLLPAVPAAEECLLVPFHVDGQAVGTIWAIAHDADRPFDGEDLRLLTSLGTFASAAYQAVRQLDALAASGRLHERDALQLTRTNEALVLGAVRQDELAEASEALNARLQAAIAEKEYFIAVLSHELRTPLAPVLIAAAMLQQDQALDPDARGMMEMIHRNITQEARLIDDLLDMTRMERGALALDRRPIDLRDVVEQAVEVCRADLEAGGLTLRVDSGAEPLMVDADPGRIQQVFSNLLRNSIKFTPPGGRVRIRARCEQACTVEVRDSGAGIDPDFLPRAFSAFEQGDKSVTRKAGLGLGLAICKTIVDLHGGSIAARSDGKGRGSTFVVTLPPIVGAHPGPATDEPAAIEQPRAVKPLRILLVEDHADTARIMRRLLATDGHAVQWAADVASGFDLAASHDFDLLLSDLGLPDGTGVDLMRSLRQAGSTLPGIALSGYGQDQDLARSRAAGFSTHLVKPVNPGELRAAIAELVG